MAFVFPLMPSDFVLCLCLAFDHLDELFGLCLSNRVFVLICCQHTHQGGGNSKNQIDMNLDFIVMSVFCHLSLGSDERFGLMLVGIACRYCDSSMLYSL